MSAKRNTTGLYPIHQRRSYGTGSLFVRTDSAGRETWHGKWRTNGRQVMRRVGVKRSEGARDGLTRCQAEAELRRLIAETHVTAPTGERLTVPELGDRYLLNLERQGRKKATTVAVGSILDRWLVPFFGTRAIDSIRAEDVVDLISLMENGQRPWSASRVKPCSPKTIRNYIGTLSALFNFAERKGWATANPARLVELPAAQRNEDIRFLEPDEVEALANAAVVGEYQAIDRALYLTAAMTGLRQGELIALRWLDVDWTAARVRVRQNYVLGEFGTPKSKRSTRSVPMADAVGGRARAPLQGQFMPGRRRPRVRRSAHGGPLQKAAILRRYRRALKAARLDSAHRFHDLRHTFGTRMAGAGVPMRTLQEWMGHRDIETTQRYADYAPSAHEAAFVAAAFGNVADACATNRATNLSESQST